HLSLRGTPLRTAAEQSGTRSSSKRRLPRLIERHFGSVREGRRAWIPRSFQRGGSSASIGSSQKKYSLTTGVLPKNQPVEMQTARHSEIPIRGRQSCETRQHR